MNDRGAEDDSRAGAVFQFQMQCLRSTALDTRSLDGGEEAGRNVKQCECQVSATSSQGKVLGKN